MSIMYDVKKSEIDGICIITPNVYKDSRGNLTKLFQSSGYADECNIGCSWDEILFSETTTKGVVRGFHYQSPPFDQNKAICVLKGAIILWWVDIRKESKSYGKVEEILLDAENRKIVFLPVGMANAYQVLEDDTQVLYMMTGEYNEESALGIRWDSFGLDCPIKPPIFSSKDESLPEWSVFETPFIE